ncbi:MAG TPA: hypothetical protein VFO67_10345 [Gemmatimonadales bacterium]|nr:hypothetical protein [Gemmatimonadales bacterium]
MKLLLMLLLVAQGKPAPPRRTALNLFAHPGAVLEANRVICGLDNVGQLCASFASSPIGGGAFWPKGTPDQYIFNSGLQMAALIPAGAGFAWAGDTIGAFFFDPRGDQSHGSPRSDVFNSRDSADAVNWPNGAVIRDATTFDARLIGRNFASEQDLWMRYWEGSPHLIGGRPHPMGVLVDQRLLAWNYPTGNQDVFYVVATLYNVTARTAGVYANPTIPPELQSEVAAAGREFQDSAEQAFALSIPDGGYALDSMYVQLGMDHDIAVFNHNYGTASVPFGIGIGYTGTFLPEVGWVLPPDPFGAPPFAAAPGLVGTTFLRSPAPFAMFTNTTGGGSFPDPVGVALLWRRMSGNLLPTDTQCTFADPAVARARHVCFLVQVQIDSRYQMSTGPFSLAPGEAKTLVMAYIFAPPLDTATAYVGGDLKPEIPFTGDSIALDTTKIRAIERVAGWRTQSDLSGNGAIEANEVIAARRSLLHKAQVAQAIVDAKFLMPQPPDTPEFFLIPGDNQVTIVWQPSASEASGDPYFALASDRSSALYDPNYRQFDVEGYRIYRGTDPRSLTLLAQFDHDNTSFVDYTGAVAYPGQCAPELGVVADCPAAFPPTPDTTVSVSQPVFRRIVQVPEGGRIVSSNGLVTTVTADTFPGHGFEPPFETGVPFAFTDSTAVNSFRYYYAVTVYDFNSIRSGPSSFESPRFTKLITPRASSGQETAGMVQAMRLLGGDGSTLDSAMSLPAIDPATGVFSGPMPPTDGLALEFTTFIPELLASGNITVTIDSIATGMAVLDVLPGAERPALYFLTSVSAGLTSHLTLPLQMRSPFSGFDEATAQLRFGAALVDSAQAARFGAAPVTQLAAQVTLRTPNALRLTNWGRGDANAIPPNSAFNGPRWWVGAGNENTANPNGGVCAPSTGFCANTSRVPNIARSAGAISGVTIFHVQSYNTIPNTPGRIVEAALATVTRAADFKVFWGTAGVVDSVIDLTHRVRVPFSTQADPSWGILTEASFAGVTEALTGDTKNTLLTWSDLFCVEPLPVYTQQCGGAAQTPAALQNTATLGAIAIRDTASSYAGTAAAGYTATGNGFIFYLNGHFFLMQMTSLPAAGTVWNARFYAGTVTGSAAQGNFAFVPAVRPPNVPGLRAQISFQGSELNAVATTDSMLDKIHTVPDPFYLMSGFEVSPDTLQLKFVHLPAMAIVRIYSLYGILVNVLTNNDPTGGGELTWDLKSRSGKQVASGVYFYHVETMDHKRRVGRFTIVSGKRNQ